MSSLFQVEELEPAVYDRERMSQELASIQTTCTEKTEKLAEAEVRLTDLQTQVVWGKGAVCKRCEH